MLFSIFAQIETAEVKAAMAAAATAEERQRAALAHFPKAGPPQPTKSQNVTEFVAKARLPVVGKYNFGAETLRTCILALREARRRTRTTPEVWEISVGVHPTPNGYACEFFHCALRFARAEDATVFKMFWKLA